MIGLSLNLTANKTTERRAALTAQELTRMAGVMKPDESSSSLSDQLVNTRLTQNTKYTLCYHCLSL